MFVSEKSIIIKGNLEKVYTIAETYPRFVPFYKKKEVLFENQEKIIVRISSIFYGKELSWEGQGIKNKNKSIDFIQTKGLLRGLRATWVFEDLRDDRVKVSIKTQLNFHFFLGKIFEKILGNLLIPNTTTKILSSLKYTIDSIKQ